MAVSISEFKDDVFGNVKVRTSSRAGRIIFRVREGKLNITVPTFTSLDFVKKSIANNRTKIERLFKRTSSNVLHVGSVIESCCFTIVINSHSIPKIFFSLKNGVLNIFVPSDIDVEDYKFQKILKSNIIRIAKRTAAPYLEKRLNELALANNLKYNKFSLSHGKQRLGVCNSKRDISLSVYLIFYPPHIIDYIILHELAHLTVMNHSSEFHSLCDKYCNGNERKFERELKQFKNPLF